MNRRNFLEATSLGGLATIAGLNACTSSLPSYSDKHFHINSGVNQLPKLKLSMDRIVKETVGLRPFRASGPRLDTEMLGNKTIIHNYGHGGSGWSLSWGTASITREKALATGEKKIAVLGCGAIGIATARLLQEKGCEVTIYTKDLPPNITSSLATGTWSPASRVCDPSKVGSDFKALWEKATLFSFKQFQFLLGLNDIVAWVDEYNVYNELPQAPANFMAGGEAYELPLLPEKVTLTAKEHPFKAKVVTRRANMMFNIPSYIRHQTQDFVMYGGKIKVLEIKKLEDIDALPEKVVMNCMGLGTKAIFKDDELMPVSGQLSCLIPQPEVTYKLNTKGANLIARKDGIYLGGNGILGNWDTTPSREQTEKVVHILQDLMNSMKG
ncbi:FAD-dependent oxidoreductase [Flectobacillus major]|uniref:FAD-dependent oxidoreductase n=1 Tax=Flectobacillus major TaxID=103 RepID=UPI00042628AE|nr:FAD-dependent oxidoreductase [Flectobacillus major]